MKVFTIFRVCQTFDIVSGYQVTEYMEETMATEKKAMATVDMLNAKRKSSEVYYLEEGEEGEPWDSKTQHKITYGSNYHQLHPKLKPLIYNYCDGTPTIDDKDVLPIKDIEYYLRIIGYKDGSEVVMTHEILDIIVASLAAHRQNLNKLVGNI